MKKKIHKRKGTKVDTKSATLELNKVAIRFNVWTEYPFPSNDQRINHLNNPSKERDVSIR